MILIEDWRLALGILIIAIPLLVVAFIFDAASKPQCPEGSLAQHTRGGWYCTVEPVKK